MGVARILPASLGTPGRGITALGARASADWLTDRGFQTPTMKRWHVEVSIATLDEPAPLTYDDRVDTRFHVDVYSEEWGFFFCHGGQASWIRVTDIPFVHGRDDFRLLGSAPGLADVGQLMRTLEARHNISLRRRFALVRSNVPESERRIRSWVESL